MYQKIKRITIIVLAVCLFIGALLYFVPWITRVNLTLDAVKLDSDGNVVGDTTITIKGAMLDYLFQKDSLDVSIYPFDDFKWVNLSQDSTTNRVGIMRPHHKDCMEINCSTYDYHTNSMTFCKLLFTKDFKYVAFVADFPGDGDNIYYVASANNEVSTEELIAYFRYLPPFG